METNIFSAYSVLVLKGYLVKHSLLTFLSQAATDEGRSGKAFRSGLVLKLAASCWKGRDKNAAETAIFATES